jgi:O-antigen/teichoic acid export membrane protein
VTLAAARLAWSRARSSPLARASGHMLAGQLLRVGTQAAYFVLLARSLAPDGYGTFVGVTALVAIAAPFASLGGGNLLIKAVARDPSRFAAALGNAWLMVGASGAALLALVLGVAPLVLPRGVPLELVALVGVAELLFARVLDVCGAAFQARHQLARTSLLQLLLSVCRLAGIALVYATGASATPRTWGAFYLAATIIAAAVGARLVLRELGRPALDLHRLRAELGEGALFAASLSAQSVYNDLDKTMLARLSALAATGIYGAAYRILDVAFLPVRSLLFAAYAHFFRHGASGLRGTVGFARRLLPVAVGYAAVTVLLLVVLAPLVPRLLGARYGEVVPALRWLSPILLLRAVHYFAADALTGAGRQGLRSAVQLVVAAFNVGLDFALIPRHGWRGAAWASLASDALLAVLLLAAVALLHRKELRHAR